MEHVQIEGITPKASRVGLGTWAMGGWMWGGTDEERSIRTICTALDRGITLIDTAPVYGQGRSEEIVGKALQRWGQRDRVVLATKVGLEWDRRRRSPSGTRAGSRIREGVHRFPAPAAHRLRRRLPGALARSARPDRGDRRGAVSALPPGPHRRDRREQLLARADGGLQPGRAAAHRRSRPTTSSSASAEARVLPYCERHGHRHADLRRALPRPAVGTDAARQPFRRRRPAPDRSEVPAAALRAVPARCRRARPLRARALREATCSPSRSAGCSISPACRSRSGVRAAPEQLDPLDEAMGWSLDADAHARDRRRSCAST